MADGFGDWTAKVIDVFDREHWRLLLIQLVVCVPFWALAGWIVTDVVDTASFSSFLAGAHIPGLLDVEVAVGPETQMSIIGYYLGPDAVAADITTVLTVESLSFALCASLYLVTLRAAGRHVTVLTGLRLAARRVWPVLGWPLVGLAVVVIGFQVPLFADFFLGTPIAILVSTAAGIQLATVFAASLVGATEEIVAEIAGEVDALTPFRRQPTTQFDRPEFGVVFDYPAHMRQATAPVDWQGSDHPGRRTATVRLVLDSHNGITLNRRELGELFTGRHPRAIRRAVDQFMTGLAGSPVRGTGITAGGLPAFEYEFACSASAVPNLRSHSFVLIDGTTQYLINCESTDTCRHDMAWATEVVLRSLRHR